MRKDNTTSRSYTCGRCGWFVIHDDEHQRAHLYGWPMGAFVLVTDGRPSLGVFTGINPLATARYVPIETYDPEFAGFQTELWKELVQFVNAQKGELREGYYRLPEDISQYSAIGSALRKLTIEHFPNHIICPDCDIPIRACDCPDGSDEADVEDT